MSKQFYKVMIDDILNNGCTDIEVEELTNIFIYTVKKTATTLARESLYDLADFASTKENGIDNFSLLVFRNKGFALGESWSGVFKCGNKQLDIMATLEK
jgi:hypothetical protein